MTIFGPGLMRERHTGRPLAGRVVQVRDPGTDAPVGTVSPVVTDADGYYDEFETVDSVHHVYLRTGSHTQHAVAVGAILTPVGQGNDVLSLVGSVANEAALPGIAEDGQVYITADDFHLWAWLNDEWVDMGTAQGPPGSDASVTDTDVAAAIGSTTRAVLDADYLTHVPVTRLGVRSDLPNTDQSAAIQAAIDLGVPLFFPAGRYNASGLVPRNGMRLMGAGKGDPDSASPRTILRTTTGDLFVSGAYFALIQDMELQANGTNTGDLVRGHWSQGAFRSIRALQYNLGKGCFNVTGWIDMTIEGSSEIITQPLGTAPGFRGFTGSANIAQISFRDVRFKGGGGSALSPHIWLEAVNGGASVITGVTIDNVNFEIPHAGCMRLLSCRAVNITGSGAWDLHEEVTHNMIYIGASPTNGAPSGQITIDGWNRDTTTPPTGMDIRAEASTFDLNIVNPGHQVGQLFKIDAGGASGRMIGTRGTLYNGQNMTTDIYQQYTPTVNPTVIGDGTLTGRYKRTGREIHVVIELLIGSTTNVGGMRFSLPVPPVNGTPIEAVARDASASATYQLGGRIDGGTAEVRPVGAAGLLGNFGSSAPFAWAAGDTVTVSAVYRAS